MAKPEVPDIVISIDLGGSMTKVAASTSDGKHKLLALASEVSEIPLELLVDIQSGMWGDGSPETVSWVGVKNGSAYAVGAFARHKFRSQIDLKVSKTDLAVPKILSALWILKQKMGLDNSFYARLGILLPSGECSNIDRQELLELLAPALKGFSTPTGKMTVRLFGQPVIKPEGGGIFLHYKNGSSDLQHKRTGIVGLGYRNANLLICDRGTIGDSDRFTSDLGFHTLVDRCREQVGSTIADTELAATIAQAGFEVNSRIVKRFLSQRNKERRLEGTVEAIAKSQTMYLSLLFNWFKQLKVSSLDDLVFYGGTAEYFKQPLTEYFHEQVNRISWHSDVVVPQELLENTLAESGQGSLQYRFIDCWCFQQFVLERQTGYSVYESRALEFVS